MDSQWERAAAALNSVADLLDAFADFGDNFDERAFAAALTESQTAARALRLPFEVGRAFDRAVASSCECCFASRRQGDIFASREKEKEKKRRTLKLKNARRVFEKTTALSASLACVVAFFFTPYQFAAIVPLAFVLHACGYDYPLKACASVLKALKKTR